MDREAGMDVLRRGGWLRDTPVDFREAILSLCRWQRLEAGALIQAGGEDEGELIGLARGIIELRTVLGRADTQIMHFAHPVFWFGFVPIVASRPRPLAASAKTPIWIARAPQAAGRTTACRTAGMVAPLHPAVAGLWRRRRHHRRRPPDPRQRAALRRGAPAAERAPLRGT
jgi:hypothetical protein